jgi:hypothetical protein
MLVLEAQPQLLERVPVVADLPAHRVPAVVERVEVELVPREGVLAVERVGSLGVARVAVDRDADQVSSDGAVAAVVEPPPLVRSVAPAVVRQLGLVVLD